MPSGGWKHTLNFAAGYLLQHWRRRRLQRMGSEFPKQRQETGQKSIKILWLSTLPSLFPRRRNILSTTALHFSHFQSCQVPSRKAAARPKAESKAAASQALLSCSKCLEFIIMMITITITITLNNRNDDNNNNNNNNHHHHHHHQSIPHSYSSITAIIMHDLPCYLPIFPSDGELH